MSEAFSFNKLEAKSKGINTISLLQDETGCYRLPRYADM